MYSTFSKALTGMALAAALLLGSAPLHASTILAQSIEEMSQQADAVALAEVLALEAVWQDGAIVTNVTLRVLEVWAGHAPATLQLQHLGGTLDGMRTHVAGADHYEAGQEVVVFLEQGSTRWRSLALSWSVFLRHGDQAVRQPQGLQILSPPSSAGSQARVSSATHQENILPLDELRARVRSVHEVP